MQSIYLIVLSAMVISSFGGKILNKTVADFPEVAAYQPVINGVAGNLVSVQVSFVEVRRIYVACMIIFRFNLTVRISSCDDKSAFF